MQSNTIKIVDYWNRRGQGLSNAEWCDFYRLVIPVLMRTRLPSAFNDASKRKDLVNTFFYDKVFLNAASTKAGPLQNVHALHVYLKRFALDSLDEAESDERDFSDPDPDSDPELAPAPQGSAHAQLLGEAGIDIGAAIDSADRFLTELQEGERAYLRDNSCADEWQAQPISRIAERLALGATYHRMAQKLGITRMKGETWDGYEQTRIGRWLRSVGAQLRPDWREEVATLLIVLCERVRVYKEKLA